MFDAPPPTPPARIMVGRHYPELDGIRGVAILLVVVSHSRIIARPAGAAESFYCRLAESGWIGVDLFFVLSGFLITGILLDTCGEAHYFRNFYARRVLRIFPVYYAVLASLALLALAGPFDSVEQDSVVAQASYWLYLQNWLPMIGLDATKATSHFWSLAVEEQFYLVWPALVLLAARRRAVGTLCVATVVLAVVARVVFVRMEQRAYYFTPSHLDALALGAGAAVLYQRRGSLMPTRAAAWRFAALGAAGVLFVAFRRRSFYCHDQHVIVYGLLPVAVLCAGFLCTALTSHEDGLLRRVLRGRFLRFVGAISYGIYIFHWPLIILLTPRWMGRTDDFWINQFGFLALVAACSIAVAWLSYRFFESPILAFKRRFSSEAA